jgi:hypothetical protein
METGLGSKKTGTFTLNGRFQADSWHTCAALTPAQPLLGLALGEPLIDRGGTIACLADTVRYLSSRDVAMKSETIQYCRTSRKPCGICAGCRDHYQSVGRQWPLCW